METEMKGKIGQCQRCNRKLTDPRSVARGMGPYCYKLCGGGIFDGDLDADEAEWTRREEVLKNGGEIDFGVNWKHIDYDPEKALQLPRSMRASVRYRDGAFEAYGHIFGFDGEAQEILFARSTDLKMVYRKAVEAGPASNAMVDRIKRSNARKVRAQRRAQRRGQMSLTA